MKIIFVVTAFYPEQAIGAVRITKMVKFAVQAGHDVTVLSLPPPPWAAADESLRFPGLDAIRWTSIPQSRVFRGIFQRARVAAIGNRSGVESVSQKKGGLFSLSSWRSSAQFIYTLLKAIDWVIQIRRHVAHELNGRRFDLIFTSYPSLASPFAGVMLKYMHKSRHFMVDFRDPITYGKSAWLSVSGFIERWLLERADFASFASAGVCMKMIRHDGGLPPVMKVIQNGFDADDVLEIEPFSLENMPQETLHFVYVGALYGGKREFSPFFQALAEALEENRASRPVIIHYAGLEGAIFRSQAARHGLETLVRDHGRVPRKKSLGLQQAADVCLVATWNTNDDQGILTGKLFESFMLRKPVIAIVNGNRPGSEMRGIITDIGAGFCYEEAMSGDRAGLVDWLRRRLREKAETGRVVVNYRPGVTAYDFRNLCRDLFQTTERLIFEKLR